MAAPSSRPGRQPPPAADDERDYLVVTREFWQKRTTRQLTREDARQMAENLVGFFSVLRDWAIAEKLREREAQNGSASGTESPAPQSAASPAKMRKRRKSPDPDGMSD